MKPTEKKSLNSPDETRTFPRGKMEMATVGGVTFGRATFNPGWKWSEHVRPIAKTKSCESAHTLYMISGHMHIKMDDGTEIEFGPGDVGVIAPGHDGWVVGNEPVVVIDITGFANYAKQS
jgi:mannose-6-phosphate isomerase-like protein (cupin superfamily)